MGPFSLKKLQQMVAKKKILPEYQISEDKILWVKAGEIKELFPEQAKPTDQAPDQIESDMLSESVDTAADIQTGQLFSTSVNSDEEGERVASNSVSLFEDKYREDDILPEQNKENNILLLSLLWNPVYALPAILEDYSVKRLKWVSLLLGLMSVICFFATLIMTLKSYGSIAYILVVAVLPFCLMSSLSAVFVKLFAVPEFENSISPNLFFLSGAALLPFGIASICSALIYMTGSFSPEQMIVVLCGFGVYSFTYAVLLIFNAFTKVFAINGGGTVFIVASLILLTSGITAFFIRLI